MRPMPVSQRKELTVDQDDATYIVVLYRHARGEGLTRPEAAQRVWQALKTTPGYCHLRAPCWGEKLAKNSGASRSYRSPLGDVLGVTGEFGQHCARWPRTKRSLEAAEKAAAAVLDTLDQLAGS